MTESERSRARFDIDLKRGQAKEGTFGAMLREATIEVKFDDYVLGRNGRPRTGNVALEFEQKFAEDEKPRPSGIHPASTTAEWFALEYGEDRWVFLRMAQVQAMARLAKRDSKTQWGGECNHHHFALVPLSHFFAVEPPALYPPL